MVDSQAAALPLASYAFCCQLRPPVSRELLQCRAYLQHRRNSIGVQRLGSSGGAAGPLRFVHPAAGCATSIRSAQRQSKILGPLTVKASFRERCSSSLVPTRAPAAKLLVTNSSRSAALASQQRLWRPWQQHGRRPPCRTPAAPRAPAPAAFPPLAAAAAPPGPAAARLCTVDSHYCAKQSLLRCPVSSSVQFKQCEQCAVRAV